MNFKSKQLNHVFTLNPESNDGESVYLHTTFERNGEGDKTTVSATQELILNSYANSAHFNFGFLLNPSSLRQLANQLEKFEANVRNLDLA